MAPLTRSMPFEVWCGGAELTVRVWIVRSVGANLTLELVTLLGLLIKLGNSGQFAPKKGP
jgi:hypothetical protein